MQGDQRDTKCIALRRSHESYVHHEARLLGRFNPRKAVRDGLPVAHPLQRQRMSSPTYFRPTCVRPVTRKSWLSLTVAVSAFCLLLLVTSADRLRYLSFTPTARTAAVFETAKMATTSNETANAVQTTALQDYLKQAKAAFLDTLKTQDSLADWVIVMGECVPVAEFVYRALTDVNETLTQEMKLVVSSLAIHHPAISLTELYRS